MSDFLFSEPQSSCDNKDPMNISARSANVLNSALTTVQSELQQFFSSPTALERLDQVFEITNQNAAHLLIENGVAGIFDNIPHIQILNDAAMNGAEGAFSETENTIYLADSLLGSDIQEVKEVLIEEIGHKFDTLVNPGGDTRGDEGELFKDVVLGISLSQPELLRIQTENDFGTVVVDNQVIAVEQSYNSTISSSPGFTKNRGGWTDNNTYPRLSGDVNGDGKDDIVGFGSDKVYVSLSNGNGTFGSPIGSIPSSTNGFTTTVGGWTDNNTYPRLLGDVNGDGKDDIVGFGSGKVYVSLSNGNGTFGAPIGSTPSSTNGFTTNVGDWTDNNNYPRVLADVNGDGKDDIVGFGSTNVFVSLSNGNGTFGAPISSSPGFTKNVGGWTDNNNFPRLVRDVNGDGRADIVGFGSTNVFVSLSNGNGTFGAPISSSPGLTKNIGGWTDNNNFPRLLADVNGDKRADLIGFGATNVFVSLSNGNGTFSSPTAYSPDLTKNIGGWTDNNNYPRVAGDVNGDGKADLIGFGASDVFVSLSGSSPSPSPSPSPTPTPSPSSDPLTSLSQKSSPLTIDEIRQYRQLVSQRPESERAGFYKTLQYKVPYFNQRDNASTWNGSPIGDVMCNVTTLASCLTYLGVKNPNPSKQFEDSLEDILRANPSSYPSTNGINAREWWGNLSKLAMNMGVASSGTQYMGGFNSTDLTFFTNFVKNNWEPALKQGKAIMAGVYTTSGGHIVKVLDIDWNRGGIIVDDPYGQARDTAGNNYKQFNYSGTQNTTSRGSVNTQNGQNENGIGNDNFWSWSYCAEVFGDTWYLRLG